MEALQEAKKAGKIRYIGFTGHKDPAVHLHMLEVAATHSFHFDTVQMPLNVMDAHFRSFEHQVLPVLVKREIGVLGMKPHGRAAVILKSKPSRRSMPALRDESADVGGDHGHRQHENSRSGVRGGPHLQADDAAAGFGAAGEDRSGGEQGEYELFKTSTRLTDHAAPRMAWLTRDITTSARILLND